MGAKRPKSLVKLNFFIISIEKKNSLKKRMTGLICKFVNHPGQLDKCLGFQFFFQFKTLKIPSKTRSVF